MYRPKIPDDSMRLKVTQDNLKSHKQTEKMTNETREKLSFVKALVLFPNIQSVAAGGREASADNCLNPPFTDSLI